MLNKFRELLPEFKIIKIQGNLYDASRHNPKTSKLTHIPFFYTRDQSPEITAKNLKKTWSDMC